MFTITQLWAKINLPKASANRKGLALKRSKRRVAILNRLRLAISANLVLFKDKLTTPEYRYCADLSKFILSLYNTRGKVSFNAFLKQFATHIFQRSCNSSLLLPLNDFPRRSQYFVRRFDRLYSRKRGGFFLKCVLSISSINTLLLGSGLPDEESLVTIDGTSPLVMNRYLANSKFRSKIRRATLRYFDRLYGSDGLKKRKALRSKLYSTKLVVNSGSVNPCRRDIPISEFPKFVPGEGLVYNMKQLPMSSVMCAELDARSLYNSPNYSAFEKYCKVVEADGLLSLFHEVRKTPIPEDPFQGSPVINRIGFKPDTKLKNRPYAKVNYWIQLALTGLHKACYSIIDQSPCNYAFGHRLAFEEMVAQLDGKEIDCRDESAATDALFLVVYRDVFSAIFGDDVASAWFDLIEGLTFYVTDERSIRYTVGQAMGTKASWPAYNIVSEVLDGFLSGTKSPSAVRVGDDSAFWGRHKKSMALLRTRNCGVTYGKNKGCISRTGVEIVKCFYSNNFEVTPLPANLLEKARFSPSAWMALVLRVNQDLSISTSTLVCLANYMSKNRNGVIFKRFLDQRLLFIEACEPGPFQDLVETARRCAILSYLRSSIVSLTKTIAAPPALQSLLFVRLMRSTHQDVKLQLYELSLEVQTASPSMFPDIYRRISATNLFSPCWEDERVVEERIYSKLALYVFDTEVHPKERLALIVESISEVVKLCP